VIGVLIRLFLCAHPCGSYDIAQVFFWGSTVYERGLAGTYSIINPYPSHAPGGFFLMGFFAWLGGSEGVFGFILRLFTTCADLATILVLWAFLSRRDPKRTSAVVVLWAVMPYIIIQASFHGNLDPIVGFFLVCAAVLSTKYTLLSGMALGVAACVKIPALLPLGVVALCHLVNDRRAGVRFCIGAAVPMCALLLPALFTPNYLSILFLRYRGTPSTYGLSFLFPPLMRIPGLSTTLPFIFVGIVAGFAVRHVRRVREVNAPVLILASILPVFFASEGFGIQYYSWIVMLLAFLPKRAWSYAAALVVSLSVLNVSLIWDLLNQPICIGPRGYRNLDFLGTVSGGHIGTVFDMTLGVCVWILCVRLWFLLLGILREERSAKLDLY
jgi:hypothetical protein